jgi:hypothetical protein
LLRLWSGLDFFFHFLNFSLLRRKVLTVNSPSELFKIHFVLLLEPFCQFNLRDLWLRGVDDVDVFTTSKE